MAVLEGDGAVDEPDGEYVLKIDVRHRAIADDERAVLGQSGDDPRDVGGCEAVLFSQRQQRIERRLDGIADRKRLDRGFVHIEAASEVGDHFFGPRLGRERLDHVVLAVEDVGDAGKARLHHQRRGHAVARAHAAEVERLLDVFGVARPAPDARHLLGRVRQRVAHTALIEPRQRRGGPHGTERRAGALGASMRAADMVGPECHQKPAAEVIAEQRRP